MKATEIVREIMERKGVRLIDVAARLGKKPTLIWDRLSQQNISVDKLNEMIRTMDYKIVAVPRETRLHDDWFEVE